MAVINDPLVLLNPASKPTAVFCEAVLFCKDLSPKAVLLSPVLFRSNAFRPNATFCVPVVLVTNELLPTAVLLELQMATVLTVPTVQSPTE